MYSVVLMAALTTSVDLPDGRRGGCGGCHGGCYGGGRHGGRGGHRGGGGGGCCGCYGGGMGYGGGGCMGMGMGYGGGGCMGMGMGMGYGGGCYGSGMGMGMGYGGGCYGSGMGMGGGCYGGTILQGGTVIQGSGSGTTTGGEKIQKRPVQKNDEASAASPATIVVDLPADAKLFIDNEATTSTGSNRVFQSPVLNAGKEYHYTLKAEILRDGKPVKAEKVVTVKAGAITPVTLTLPPVGVAQH